MKCTNCGQECKEGSLFCSSCGAKLITEEVTTTETVFTDDNVTTVIEDDKLVSDKILEHSSVDDDSGDKCFVSETETISDVTPEEISDVAVEEETLKLDSSDSTNVSSDDEPIVEKQLTKKEERQKLAHQKVNAKSDAKFQKKVDKYQKRQDMINSCPLPFRPIPFAQYFWLNLLALIPVVGLLVAFFGSFCPKNHNIKNLERSYLLWHLIALIIIGILSVYAYVNYGDSSMREAFHEMMGAFHK